MSAPPCTRRNRGTTLIELVIAIVVLSTALAGVLRVMNLSTRHSVDPMLLVQAEAIAQAYLEEVLLRDFSDPDGADAGETRATYDDVDDYDALAANGCTGTSAACPALGDCACDQFGEPLAALAGFRVAVAVAADMLNGAPAKRIDVTVTHVRAADLSVMLSGYRTDF